MKGGNNSNKTRMWSRDVRAGGEEGAGGKGRTQCKKRWEGPRNLET
jgi:hypothetical protein